MTQSMNAMSAVSQLPGTSRHTRRGVPVLIGTFLLCCPYGQVPARAEPSVVAIHEQEVLCRVTPWLTGACIEDVNHEIYGGIYSQMIFGESFQEDALSDIAGFRTYGGTWALHGAELHASGMDGAKLVTDHATCEAYEAGVEVYLDTGARGPSGLILQVSDPGVGADRFVGYEIGLGPGLVRIGKHENDFTLLQDLAYPVPVGEWVSLRVKTTARTLTVFVNDTQVTTYTHPSAPIPPGGTGLRLWDGPARFRNFWVHTESRVREGPFTGSSGTVSAQWREIRQGPVAGSVQLVTERPFKGRQSQRITFLSGQGTIGIENRGLNRWGMHVQAGKPYEGYLWVRAQQPTDVVVALESADGSDTHARAVLKAQHPHWSRLDFTLTPDQEEGLGQFAIRLTRPGSVDIGHAFLQPGEWGRFHGLPVRKDIAEGLVAQKLTVMRLGGCMAQYEGYRWKNQIGPRDLRPATGGWWYPHSSMGWGIFDFLNFCEAAGMLGIPTLNYQESPEDVADFMEYVNGPSESEWGRQRTADGHPEPYHLKYLQIGNEEAVDSAYFQAFKPVAEAVWAMDPEVILIVGDFAYSQVIQDPYDFDGAPRIRSLAAHKQILDLATRHGREVWFDIHMWTENPPQPTDIPAVQSLYDRLGELSPDARYKIVCFEFNANHHHLNRALANAHAINELQRMGDRVAIAASANCLQPDGQNDNGWNQGLLFFNPEKVWGQPPYYVTRMAAAHYQPVCCPAVIPEALAPGIDVTATRSENGDIIVIQAVNMSDQTQAVRFTFDRFEPDGLPLTITTLQGLPGQVNSAEQPDRIVPERTRRTASAGERFALPAHSFTVLQFGEAGLAPRSESISSRSLHRLGSSVGSRLRSLSPPRASAAGL